MQTTKHSADGSATKRCRHRFHWLLIDLRPARELFQVVATNPARLGFFLIAWAVLGLARPAIAAVTIDAVYLAQTHVHQPNHPYYSLVGNKDTLIKVHVVDPAASAAPAVTVQLTLGAQTTNLTLTGPAVLPTAIPNGLGVVQHAFSNTFTAIIPRAWVKPNLTALVQAGVAQTNLTNLKIGAPTKVIMNMIDVHYFAQASGNYPSGWEAELEAKWPVADLEIRRLRNVVFPELVIPPRAGAPAARIMSPADYTAQTGLSFDGEQAAALEWNGALKAAAGTAGRVALHYLSIYGANAGGQAGGFAGVGSGTSIGILHHELGHALSLPHWGDNTNYPYKGDMHGINAPPIYMETHAGPVWAFDPLGQKFIPCTVQPGNVGGRPPGTYKVDPMQGGGTGYQEPGYRMNHFSDYSVNQMRGYLEGHVVLWNTNTGRYASWNNTTKDYTTTVTTNGVNYPLERDVNVISILASVSGASPEVSMVYPPIGPYLGSLIRRFNPSVAADRTAAAAIFAPSGGCDVCVRVVQGGVTNTYMLAASWNTAADPLAASSLETAAVNLRASDGAVTQIELLLTPNAQVNGLPANPQVLYVWPGYLGAKSYYWDNNGATAGFGTAAGIWAAPAAGNATQGFSTNAGGTLLPGNVTVSGYDDVNFGNGTNGLATGTITVSNTVAADSVNFASGSGAITLTNGTIATRSITAQNNGNIIHSAIEFTAAGTVSFSRNINSPGSLTLNGPLSGDDGVTFTTPNVSSGNHQQTILLGDSGTYAGDTEITTGNTGTTLWVRAGATNALPPTTILLLNGGNGSGSGRTVAFDLNGFPQTLAGLTNISGLTLRNQRVLNSSATAALLTVSNTASFTFGGNIGTGGTNLGLIKSGAGTLTLTNSSAYSGLTSLNGLAGALRIRHALALGSTAAGTSVIGVAGNLSASNARLELEDDITVTGETLTLGGGGNALGALTSLSGTNEWAGNVTLAPGFSGTQATRLGASAGATLEVSGVIDSGTNNVGLGIRTAGLTGIVILSGSNAYLGNTSLLIGKLQLGGGDNRLPVATRLVLGNSTNVTEFDLNGRNQEISGLAISSGATAANNSITNSSGTLARLTVNAAAAASTFGGVLEGNLALTKTGSNLLTLSGTNTYTGATTVSGGTLALGASNVLANTTPVTLGNATLAIGAGFTDTVGTLETTNTATINLGASNSALAFANSSARTWTGTLNLTGAFVSGSSLRFGTNNAGLTPAQLALISAPGFDYFSLNASGYLIAADLNGTTPAPVVMQLQRAAGVISLWATGSNGLPYRLWTTTNLPAGNWQLLTNGTVTSNPFVTPHPGASTEPWRFYRFTTP